jgi:hypothetical protein
MTGIKMSIQMLLDFKYGRKTVYLQSVANSGSLISFWLHVDDLSCR